MQRRSASFSLLLALLMVLSFWSDGSARSPDASISDTSATATSRLQGSITLPAGRTVQLPPRTSHPRALSASELAQQRAALARVNRHGPPPAVAIQSPPRNGPPVVPQTISSENVVGTSPGGKATDNGSSLANSPTAPISLNTAASSQLVLFRNTALGTTANGGMASTVDEPSVSTNGNEVFYTGNWYAAVSGDGGQTFSYVDPYSAFPSAYGGFCCDQVTIYDPSRNLTFWLVMYSTDTSGNNALRLAVAKGQSGVLSNTWTYSDLTPQAFGWNNGTWFDFPQLALSSNDLYLTTNIFDKSNAYVASEIFRVPLDALASGGSLPWSYYSSQSLFNFTPVSGATTTMYFGTHLSTSTLDVLTWPESVGSNGITIQSVSHSNDPSGSMNCTSPDGTNACGDEDSRVSGGWLSGGTLGFAWETPQGTSGLGTFPYPYIHVVRIDTSNLTLQDEPIIWSNSYAWAYPGLAVNGRGVGISAVTAGGGTYPSSSILVRDDISPNSWQTMSVRNGQAGPSGNRWGDFLTVHPASGNGNTWVATSYTLQAACSSDPCSNVEPRFLWFGRQRDNPLSYPNDPLVTIDNPTANASVSGTVTISGWAIDRNAGSGTGISTVQVFLDGDQSTGTNLGTVTYGVNRGDVATQYGAQFADSGWSLAWDTTSLSVGTHTLSVYTLSSVTNLWSVATISMSYGTPTATPTPTGTSTPTTTPTQTPIPNGTLTATLTATITPTATPTVLASSTPGQSSYQVYLPEVVSGP